MSFIWPAMLVFLLVVPIFIGMYLRLQSRRRALAASFGSLGFGAAALGSGRPASLGLRRYLPPALFLIGLTLLMLALARPQAIVSLPKIEGTVILAFDVSGSMAATDMEPTRMEAAKSAAREFIQRQPSTVQIGVVAFSESGFSVQAPTNNQEAVLASVNRLSPQRGTSLANGILSSLITIAGRDPQDILPSSSEATEPTPAPIPPEPEGTYDSAVIVLLTDGDNNAPPDPLEAAQAAADREVPIYTLGIGNPAGTVLEIEGYNYFTQLNEPMLQAISELTGGTYYNAASEEDLQAIYKNLTPRFVIRPEKMEITSILAGASLFILLLGGIFSLLWFGRLL
jgi:Ca-activated chloride channel family protein